VTGRRVHAGCGLRNPFVPWLWAALIASQGIMWPVLLLTGSWLAYLAWLPWLLVLALLLRWERVHSPEKMYRTWSP